MVFRVSLVPSIMGCHDGTMELCLAPDVDTTSAFYGGLFWIYSSHSIFQSGRKCPPTPWSLLGTPWLNWNQCKARKYYSHFDLIYYATCLLDMVSCQLFSDGFKRVRTTFLSPSHDQDESDLFLLQIQSAQRWLDTLGRLRLATSFGAQRAAAWMTG